MVVLQRITAPCSWPMGKGKENLLSASQDPWNDETGYAAWGERSWVREPHIPNLMKKIHTKEMTRNVKFFHAQCSVLPQLSRNWVPTSPTVDNGLITDPGHFSEFHWEGFQNRLQRAECSFSRTISHGRQETDVDHRVLEGPRAVSFCAAKLN